jgi:hypothetical protein
MDSGDTSNPVKQDNLPIENKIVRNPTGRGGFGDNPQNINRYGRPIKGKAVTDQLWEIVKENPQLLKTVAARLWKGAADGELPFIRELMDRLEGKPVQRNEVGGVDGSTLETLVVIKNGSSS